MKSIKFFFKRSLAVVLALTTIASYCDLASNNTVSAEDITEKTSYTVIVFNVASMFHDTSEISADYPFDYFKHTNFYDYSSATQVLEHFIPAVINKNRLDKAKIAIVLYGLLSYDESFEEAKQSLKIFNFSSNYDDIMHNVNNAENDDKYKRSDRINISEGLDAANSLLEEIQDTAAEKNVILFSGGWSSYGNTKEDGHYNKYSIGEKYSPCHNEKEGKKYKLNAYMNCAYDESLKIKNQGANLYVMHSFYWLEDYEEDSVKFNSMAEYFGAVDLDLASSEDHFYSFPCHIYDSNHYRIIAPGADHSRPDFQTKLEPLNAYAYDRLYIPEDAPIKNKYSCCKEALDDIINKITHNTDYPILIIPGIMGSRFFRESENDKNFNKELVIWPPDQPLSYEPSTAWERGKAIGKSFFNLLTFNPETVQRIRPCENQNVNCSGYCDENTVTQYGREYGSLNTYEKLVEKLCDEYSYSDHKRYREVYFFSYDWTYSIINIADDLDETINKILHDTGSKKIDIIAHSMGGLITSHYFSYMGGYNIGFNHTHHRNKINKIITCGTPYEGAPKTLDIATNATLFGRDPGKCHKSSLINLFSCLTPKVIAKLPSVRDLTPTENYMSEIPMQRDRLANCLVDSLIAKDSINPYGSLKLFSTSDLTLEEYAEIFYNIFPLNFSDVSRDQKRCHTSKDKTYNILLDYDKSYFALGINQKTVESVTFFPNDSRVYDVNYENRGDGTVPYLSASMMNKLEDRYCHFDTDHEGIVKDDDCLNWIVDILNDGTSAINSSEFSYKPYMKIRIEDEADIQIEKNDEILSSDPENPSFITSFGRLDLLKTSEEGKYIKCLCIDTDTDYRLSLKNQGNRPVSLSVKFFNGDGSLKESKMLALDSTDSNNICEIFKDFVVQNIA